MKTKILFVCLGNICRSPAAEAILKYKIQQMGISSNFTIDSAGTSAHHVGERADSRMRKVLSSHGVESTCRSRQLKSQDYNDFDYIIAMDESNLKSIQRHKNIIDRNKIFIFTDLAKNKFSHYKGVPDPYYGGEEGFIEVYYLLCHLCDELIQKIS